MRPDAAYFHQELGEFILPYESVRNAKSREEAIRSFVESTYVQGADLAKWNRAALERRRDPELPDARKSL